MIHSYLNLFLVVIAGLLKYTVYSKLVPLKSNALDEECGIYPAILHKHKKSNKHVQALNVGITNKHGDKDKVYGQRDWPWLAVVRNNTDFLCDAMLVRKDYVLTTASCIHQMKASEIIIDLKGKIFKVKEYALHDGFDKKNPSLLTSDLALIQLSEKVPIDDPGSGVMSICTPRSLFQPLNAQECAVSSLWETDKERSRIEMDTAAMVEDVELCQKKDHEKPKDDIMTCVSNKVKKKPFDAKKGQVLFFLTCKTSGYWSVFGLTKFSPMKKAEKSRNREYTYYLTLVKYLPWVRDIIYGKKPISLA